MEYIEPFLLLIFSFIIFLLSTIEFKNIDYKKIIGGMNDKEDNIYLLSAFITNKNMRDDILNFAYKSTFENLEKFEKNEKEIESIVNKKREEKVKKFNEIYEELKESNKKFKNKIDGKLLEKMSDINKKLILITDFIDENEYISIEKKFKELCFYPIYNPAEIEKYKDPFSISSYNFSLNTLIYIENVSDIFIKNLLFKRLIDKLSYNNFQILISIPAESNFLNENIVLAIKHNVKIDVYYGENKKFLYFYKNK